MRSISKIRFHRCLLQLEKSVKFNRAIEAVELPVKDVENGSRATVSGWGRVTHAQIKPMHLRKLSVTIFDKGNCQDYNVQRMPNFRYDLDDSQVCGFTESNVGYGFCLVSLQA